MDFNRTVYLEITIYKYELCMYLQVGYNQIKASYLGSKLSSDYNPIKLYQNQTRPYLVFVIIRISTHFLALDCLRFRNYGKHTGV